MFGLGGIMGMMGGPMGMMDLKGLSDSLTNKAQQSLYDGWGEWEATRTVVLNADADPGGDGSIALLGTLAPSDYYLI